MTSMNALCPRNDIEPQAEYCLLYQEPPSICKLPFSSIALRILYYTVIAKASLMTAATVYMFSHFKTEPIFNVGDAIASYLEHPENSPNSILCNQTWAKSWPTAISFLGDVLQNIVRTPDSYFGFGTHDENKETNQKTHDS
ncbi:hypothetical protein BTUL_0056g00190 [Botrytis tulipae]|uniref:Uncharacterized protein n=1 Tax=Botrytis tulipae TaxID=87230 RepID=A0A4Z1EYF5_9HELO|nr:hypothetical protein BTUL_0056g00190 [Botrytis tulipae]